MAESSSVEDKTVFLWIAMNFWVECEYPQEPFPSSAHIYVKCCMGDKVYHGEFWGYFIMNLFHGLNIFESIQSSRSVGGALDNVEGGWCECMPLAVKAVDGYFPIHVFGILSFIPKKLGAVGLSFALRLAYVFPLWMHRCVNDSYGVVLRRCNEIGNQSVCRGGLM